MKSKGFIESKIATAYNIADILLSELANNNPYLSKALMEQRLAVILQNLDDALSRLALEED